MKNGRFQCKDIPVEPILRFLKDVPRNPTLEFRGDGKVSQGFVWDLPTRPGCSFGFWGESFQPPNSIASAFPLGTPRKLGMAKMRRLIARGLVKGCACGCRGDFEITHSGHFVLLSIPIIRRLQETMAAGNPFAALFRPTEFPAGTFPAGMGAPA